MSDAIIKEDGAEVGNWISRSGRGVRAEAAYYLRLVDSTLTFCCFYVALFYYHLPFWRSNKFSIGKILSVSRTNQIVIIGIRPTYQWA